MVKVFLAQTDPIYRQQLLIPGLAFLGVQYQHFSILELDIVDEYKGFVEHVDF